MITRADMLPIMQESGALDDLDINDEDFLGGHGRERTHVKVIELAWAAGRAAGQASAVTECLMAVNDSDLAAESVRAVAGRLGVEL